MLPEYHRGKRTARIEKLGKAYEDDDERYAGAAKYRGMEVHAASVTNSREQLVVMLVGTWDRDSAKEAVIALAAIATRGHEQVVGITDSQTAGRHRQLGRISALVSDVLKGLRTSQIYTSLESGARVSGGERGGTCRSPRTHSSG